MHSQKERPSTIQKATVVTLDQAMTDAEKMITELPLSDALRLVVSLRIRRNTPLALLEDHVEPIIRSNLSIAEPEQRERQPEAIIEAVTEREHQQATKGAYDGTKHSLRKRFATHRAALAEKVDRLRKDYLALHEKWMVHCARLDDIARANALEEAAATAGRTTRRSAAMGDAVRTDLEMEQILASLGNEELTDANHLSAKNAAVIPDMLSVTKGRADPMFDDTNNLVEDPHSFYALETGINDWSDEEKAAFLEKYVVHPKQFGIIAGFLPNKTPAQCVTFFYLHKNTTIDFRKLVADHNTVGKRTRRGRGGKQKGNALLADILKHDDEVSRDSTPNATSGRRRRGHASAPLPVATPLSETAPDAGPSTMPVIDQSKRPSVSRRSTAQTTPTPTPDPEPSSKRPRRRANLTAKAVAALGQEEGDDAPVCPLHRIDLSLAHEEDVRPAKRTRRARKSKVAEAEVVPSSAPTEVVAVLSASSETKFIDQTEAAARRKSAAGGVNWSDADKDLFLKLLRQHGDDFKRIAASMPNKTTIQVTSFYNANLNDMELAKVAALAPKRSPTPSASFAPSDAALSGPPTMSHRSAPVEPVRPHPPATISSPGVPASPHVPGMTQNPMRNGAPSNPGPSTPSPLPASMTSTFPSFPYTNLGPSHFGNAPLEPSAFVRLSAPQATGGSMSHPVMEFSNFAPQPWMSGAHSLVGQSPILHGSQMPGLPATLETTEDLVRYLEHRTRLTAGQNNDNDFM
ncbi:hypothetical protein BC628DRAFT_1316598 [Trametes gibbosa]|nr:hypothetical protein BC628DRAFT_1316598 [Trametes gibbosa]